MSDPRLEPFYQRMIGMSETLLDWLDKSSTSSNAEAVFFLCGVVQALIKREFPNKKGRPRALTNLLTAIDKLGMELGPAIAAVEVIKCAPEVEQVTLLDMTASAPTRQKKSKKLTVN